MTPASLAPHPLDQATRGSDPFGDGPLRGRRRRGGIVGVVLGVVALASLVSATGARAALPAGCTLDASTISCAYATTGAEQSFTVPSGVGSAAIVTIGAPGGSQYGFGGGIGGTASGSFAVTAGETLYVEVGAPGSQNYTYPGGFNGGGSSPGGGDAAGGGGASDVRTIDTGASGSLGSRLVVPGGGGGAGNPGFEPDSSVVASGAGGAAGSAGSPGSSDAEGDSGGEGGE